MEEKIKDILAELIGGADCKYIELRGIERAFCEQETKNVLMLFSQTLQELRQEVERFKYGQPLLGTPDSAEQVMFAVDSTVDQVLALIDTKINEKATEAKGGA